MPPKRRSTGPAGKSQQSTLAFHGASNRVVKPGTRAANAKKNLLTKSTKKEEKPIVEDVQVIDVDEPTTAEAAIIVQTEQVQQQTQSTPEEDEAKRITKKRIETYWKNQISESKAPRAHQEGLSLEEKILRKFDMSGQYGVSVSRTTCTRGSVPVASEQQLRCLAICDVTGLTQLIALRRYCTTETLAARASLRPGAPHRSPGSVATRAGRQGQAVSAEIACGRVAECAWGYRNTDMKRAVTTVARVRRRWYMAGVLPATCICTCASDSGVVCCALGGHLGVWARTGSWSLYDMKRIHYDEHAVLTSPVPALTMKD
jgi:DNA polymerase delta subunit 4